MKQSSQNMSLQSVQLTAAGASSHLETNQSEETTKTKQTEKTAKNKKKKKKKKKKKTFLLTRCNSSSEAVP
jgi:hypothetical protein